MSISALLLMGFPNRSPLFISLGPPRPRKRRTCRHCDRRTKLDEQGLCPSCAEWDAFVEEHTNFWT